MLPTVYTLRNTALEKSNQETTDEATGVFCSLKENYNIKLQNKRFTQKQVKLYMHIYPDLGLGNLFQRNNRSNKGKQVELHQTKKLLHSKRNPQQNEKTTY